MAAQGGHRLGAGLLPAFDLHVGDLPADLFERKLYFFRKRLEKTIASSDIEGIEHHVSPETLAKLERLVAYWKRMPSSLKAALRTPAAATPAPAASRAPRS